MRREANQLQQAVEREQTEATRQMTLLRTREAEVRALLERARQVNARQGGRQNFDAEYEG